VRSTRAKKIRKVIGVISDTHGLLRPEAIKALWGVDLILHAGDVGTAEVLSRLKATAPLIAVRGNNDKGPWAAKLPCFKVKKVGDVKLYLIHDVKELNLNPAEGGLRVVISGHSHKPSVEERDGILYLNPGSAGPRRFRLPVSLARLTVDGKTVKAELVKLSD